MWQQHYIIHAMRMDQFRAEADRDRRWRMQDSANGRPAAAHLPGRGRALAARGIAAVSRGAGRVARRLDAGVSIDRVPERLVRDA